MAYIKTPTPTHHHHQIHLHLQISFSFQLTFIPRQPTSLSLSLSLSLKIGRSMAVFHFSLVVSLLLSLCLLAPFTQASDVRYCDKKANYAVKVSGIEISPNPVARGRPATFSISATADEAISGGKLVIDVAYFGFHIYSETDELCGKTSCPISAGDFLISHSQDLPGFTPPGTYTLTMKMEDGNKNQLTCINFDFSIGFFVSDAVAAL